MRNDITSILRNEYRRYANKGVLGILGAFIISTLFVMWVPEFWKIFWPKVLEMRDSLGIANWKFMVLVTTFWHAFWVCLANSVFGVIYYLEIPFIEAYKINPNPWPWKKSEAEQAKWKSLMIKSILNTIMNGFITLPLI